MNLAARAAPCFCFCLKLPLPLTPFTASVFIDGNWVVWWNSNVKFHHYSAMYHVGAVLAAGLVLAGFVKGKPAA